MLEIDEAIARVTTLYRAVTGRELRDGDAPTAPIPAEKDPVLYVQEQVERLTAALAALEGERRGDGAWAPPCTIRETEREAVLTFDVPGVPREAVEVRVEGSVLAITGTRGPATSEGQVRLAEVRTGAFRRFVQLPQGLRLGELAAQLKDGVLEVRIPRDKQAVEARRIPVA